MPKIDRHFEEVYTESEIISSRRNKEKATTMIIGEVMNLLAEYESSLNKTACMGEIFYLLSALSSRDNVNVWGALLDVVEKNRKD